jgi:beta-glucosidase-like glycosyl hydrolase
MVSETCFVQVGATWDVNLAKAWGNAMGEEFRAKGANVQLGPGMNVARVPNNGNLMPLCENSRDLRGVNLH